MRFYDKVGYGIPTDRGDGVWTDSMTERPYRGDLSRVTRYTEESSEKVNPDFRLSNRISIMADAFALENFSHIKYAAWMGTLWTVTSVEVQRPRLILTLGGVYNGPTPPSGP